LKATSYAASIEGEARLLLLIDAFSGGSGTLQGRTKLAKLDFLLRYPLFFRRALQIRNVEFDPADASTNENTIEQRMVRFRYGPWDPAYYALLGSLLGRGLIETIPHTQFVGFRTTDSGKDLARQLARTQPWAEVFERARHLKQAFGTQGGNFLKNFIYEHFPEVTQASWGDKL